MKFIYTITKIRIAIRIWRLFLLDRLFRGRNTKVIERLKSAYGSYYRFLANTADMNTDEGKRQYWRAQALIEELVQEGENLWRKA